MNDIIQPRKTYGRRSKPFGIVRAAAMERLHEYEIKLNNVAPGMLKATELFSPLPVGRGCPEGSGEGEFSIKDSHSSPPPHPSALRAATFSLQGEGKVYLEIGFGTGEHTAALAAAHADDFFLAAEPYQAGVANLMRIITTEDRKNIRIYPADGFALLRALSPSSIHHAYLLFPDPWPKKRHHERRFIQPEILAEFARVIRPGGALLMASDDPPLAEWMRVHAEQSPDFTRQIPSPYQPHTRYAAKAAAAGRTPEYLYFTRK